MSPLVILIMVALVSVQGLRTPRPEPVLSGTKELFRGLIRSAGTKTGEMVKNWVQATETEVTGDDCPDCTKFMDDVKVVLADPKFTKMIESQASGTCDQFGESKDCCVTMVTNIVDRALAKLLFEFDPKTICVDMTFCP